MKIRPATPADSISITPMLIKTFKLHGSWDQGRYGLAPDALERYRQWIGKMYEDPRATAIVAEHENQIIGFLIATVGVNMPFYDVKEYAMLHDLWVEPEFRNRGVGRDMVRAAAAHFRKMGFTQMRASVAAANEPGRKMLESVGFAIVTHDMLMDLKPAKQSTDKSSHSR